MAAIKENFRCQIGLIFITVMVVAHLHPVSTEDPVANCNCTFSHQKQILTCSHVDTRNSNIENLLSNKTKLLSLNNSENLRVTPAFHTAPFEGLESYYITHSGCSIDPFSFQRLPNLLYLKITDCRNYSVVKSDTFYGLVELQALSLNSNNIQVIEPGAFSSLGRLKTLELTHNNFNTCESRLFEPLRNLDSLFLYHSNIETLKPDCFAGLANLRVLDLTYNCITKINTKEINRLKELTYLYLGFNKIETLEGNIECPKLQFLYLQSNKLKAISDQTFAKSHNLVDLDLSRNKIGHIDSDAFYNLSKLTNVNYKENNLTKPIPLNFKGTPPFITS